MISGRVVTKRINTGGRVEAAGCVALERKKSPVGRVIVADEVAKEGSITRGCVVAAGCIAIERLVTSGRVEAAGCVVNERIKPLAVLERPVVLLMSAS